MTPLCDLALKHGTDKFAKHFYTPIYFDLFKDRAQSVTRVLEIGIGSDKGDSRRRHAGSLRMWEEFFPNAEIIGVDRKQHLLIDEGRIRSFFGDQADTLSLIRIAKQFDGFDIMIEDGSHRPEHQVSSALTLVPFVKPGGFYIIEDIGHDVVFNEVRKRYPCERIHTNPEFVDSVLGVIRC